MNSWCHKVLFSLIYGEIAHGIKTGRGVFKSIRNATLGYEPEQMGKSSTLIQDKDGQWFRLTVEPVSRPEKFNPFKTRWPERSEA